MSPVGAGLVLVGLYVVLRSAAAAEPLLLGWTVLAVLAAVAAPAAGLTILAALGPFTEALTDEGRITAVPFLLAALGLGLLVRVVLSRPLPRLSPPLALAMVLLMGTALAVGNSFRLHGTELGMEAARLWVPGLGGALTVLLAAAWVCWHGESRPVLVLAASIVAAGLLSLADHVTRGAVGAGPLGWLLRDGTSWERLQGIIPAPNAAATIFVVGAVLAVALALAARPVWLRGVLTAAAAALVMAIVLTFSRSALVALAAAGVIVGWRIDRRLGAAVLVVSSVGALVLLPLVLAARGDLAGGAAFAADAARFEAWAAAVRMWLADSLLGHGFRSFEWLHAAYGIEQLDAPHNEWLRLFAEGGVVLGLAGLTFAALTLVTLLRTPGWLAAGCAATAAAVFVMASWNNPFLYVQVNVPAFLAIGTGLGLAMRARAPGPQGGSHIPAEAERPDASPSA